MGTDDTTLIGRVELSSFGAADDRLLIHLSNSKITACPGTRTATQSSNVLAEEPEGMERTPTSEKGEAEKLELEAWLDF